MIPWIVGASLLNLWSMTHMILIIIAVVKAMPNLHSITIRLCYNHNDVDAVSVLS